MKTCSRCKIEKSLECYTKHKSVKDGFSIYCKECKKILSAESYQRNIEKIKKKSIEYYQKNHEKIKERSTVYYNDNNKKIKSRMSEYNKKNRTKINQKIKQKTISNPLFKLSKSVRARIYQYVSKNGKKTIDLIGCSYNFLKEHLEKQFKEGMSWDNHSKYGWHIDHIVPLSSAKTEEELIKLCHYTNLQPLWWEDNLRKSNKVV